MGTSRGRFDPRRASRPVLFAVQFGTLMALGVFLGALVPEAGALAGVVGGLLAFAAVAASGALRSVLRRLTSRHPHWPLYAGAVFARELVRTGVGLVVVLAVVAPLSLGASILPVAFLVAVAAGVAAGLPIGVALELRALDPLRESVDRLRLWRAAVAAAAVAALGMSLLVAIAGLVAWRAAVAWAAAALTALAITGEVRGRAPDGGAA